MAVSAAVIAPGAFQQPAHRLGEQEDVDEDLQVDEIVFLRIFFEELTEAPENSRGRNYDLAPSHPSGTTQSKNDVLL